MNIGMHQISRGGIDQLMLFQRRFAGELRGTDDDTEVAFAFLRAGVAGMQMALILDLQMVDRECGSQALLKLQRAICRRLSHGKTCLKGFTLT